jgi:hypothetical protein
MDFPFNPEDFEDRLSRLSNKKRLLVRSYLERKEEADKLPTHVKQEYIYQELVEEFRHFNWNSTSTIRENLRLALNEIINKGKDNEIG